MKRTILIYALVLLVALMAVVAVAQGKRGNPAGPGGCAVMCQQMLNLSPGQVAEMKEIRAALARDVAPMQADLQAKMKEIAAQWAVAVPNVGEIKRLSDEADQIRAAIRNKAIDAKAACIAQLTPEQRAKCLEQCARAGAPCCCAMCAGCGIGACCVGGPNAAMCPLGPGKGPGCGMGMGPGRGPAGAGCPLQRK